MLQGEGVTGPEAAVGGALVLLAVPTAALLVRYVLRFAVENAMLDVPGDRSSHTVPTPRGGGAGIVIVVLAGIILCWALDWITAATAVAFLGGGALVAGVGWLDDRRELSSSLRIVVHLAAAIWAVTWIGVPERLAFGPWAVPIPWVGYPLAVTGVVWSVNLYNFMDGIDGLAATEAAFVCAAGGAILLLSGASGLGWLSLVTAAAAGAFLRYNWPPARIFMGDVGSGFLGFFIAVVALAGRIGHGVPLALWAILVGVFAVDATLTLLRRFFRGETWYGAHRLHAYQRLTQAGWSHRRTTSSVAGVNVGLMGLALWGWHEPETMPFAVATALVVLFLLYWAVERIEPMWQTSAPDIAEHPRRAGHKP